MFDKLKKIIKKENVTFFKLLNPVFTFKLLHKYKYTHFFFVGGLGLAINLLTVYLLTEHVFGLENYYSAYLVGLSLNLIFNFTLHTVLTFKTKKKHKTRFVLFVIYSLLLTLLQAVTVKIVTPLVGLQYYLFVIATFVLIFSTISFLFFKLYLFKDDAF